MKHNKNLSENSVGLVSKTNRSIKEKSANKKFLMKGKYYC